MLGWMLIFSLLTFASAATAMGGGVSFTPELMAGVVFGFLLLVSLLMRSLRGQA